MKNEIELQGDKPLRDERMLSWISKSDNRSKIVYLASFVANIPLMSSLIKAPSITPLGFVGVSMLFMIINTFLFGGFTGLLSQLSFSKESKRHNKIISSFTSLKSRDVGASTLPHAIRALHREIYLYSQSRFDMISIRPRDMARHILKKGGPEAALDFVRLCAAFQPLKKKIRDTEIEVDAEMIAIAERLLPLMEDAKLEKPKRKFNLSIANLRLKEPPVPLLETKPNESVDVMLSILSGNRLNDAAQVQAETKGIDKS